MTIFGQAESFKLMNRPDPTVTLFDGLFLKKYTRWGPETSLQFVLFKFGIVILYSLKTMWFSAIITSS